MHVDIYALDATEHLHNKGIAVAGRYACHVGWRDVDFKSSNLGIVTLEILAHCADVGLDVPAGLWSKTGSHIFENDGIV